MRSLVILLVVLFSVPCYGQWGDWSKPYEINNPYGSAFSQQTSRSLGALNGSRYESDSLSNPYGAGSRYQADGLRNPYSQYGSRYSNDSWTNPYATNPPKLYSADRTYYGRLSTNRYDPDSTSNPYGRYGSRYSADSINNQFGPYGRYSTQPIYVYPGR